MTPETNDQQRFNADTVAQWAGLDQSSGQAFGPKEKGDYHAKDFEHFLIYKYAELVQYTEDDTPNEDVWMDKFNDWLMELEPDEFIKYANEWKVAT